jgi:hypothetical protein
MKNSDTFVKITNQDIFNKLLEIENKVENHYVENMTQHNAIIKRLDYTNGKVKLSKWISTTALSLTLLLVGFLFNHIGST